MISTNCFTSECFTQIYFDNIQQPNRKVNTFTDTALPPYRTHKNSSSVRKQSTNKL